MSLYTEFFAGTTPIGSLFIGGVSERWNPGIALVTAGGLSAIGLVLAAIIRSRAQPKRHGALLEPGFESGLGAEAALHRRVGSAVGN